MSIRLISKSVWDNPGNRGQQIRRSMTAVGWQVWKRTMRSPWTLTLRNGVRFRAHPDCVVSSALVYADWPEFNEFQVIRRQLRNGDLVMDIGANVGHVSLLLADIVGPCNLFAFEPVPLTFRRLVENWELNGWPTDRLFQTAVGAESGKIFVPNSDRPEPKNQVTRKSAKGSVEVALICLDDFRHHCDGRRVGLLKIDVEGFEREVFRGSRLFLKDDRPRLIMFESLGGDVDGEIAAVLQAARYEVFQLDNEGRPDFSRVSAQNLFAVPVERRNEMSGD